MKNILIFIFIFILSFSITGCVPQTVRTYQPLAIGEKSMTVPAGGLYLTGTLKDVLRKNGWRLYVDTDTIGNERESGTRVISKKKIKSRYQMFVAFRAQDICFDGTALGFYDVSVIDNNSEEEILTISGKGCESSVADSFEEWLTTGKVKENRYSDTVQ